MGKKNKPIDLGVGSYMAMLQQNQRPTGDDKQDPPLDPTEDGTPEDNDEALSGDPEELEIEAGDSKEEDNQEVDNQEEDKSVNPPSRRGRPRKSKAVVRNNQKLIRFDDAMCSEIAMVKVLHKIPMQDLVYIATAKFMREYFPKGKATKEGLELLEKEMKVLYDKD